MFGFLNTVKGATETVKGATVATAANVDERIKGAAGKVKGGTERAAAAAAQKAKGAAGKVKGGTERAAAAAAQKAKETADKVKGGTVATAAAAVHFAEDVVVPVERRPGDGGDSGYGNADDDSPPDFLWDLPNADENIREATLRQMNADAMATFAARTRGARSRAASALTAASEMDLWNARDDDPYDAMYDEDDMARNPTKEERFLSHSGYIYIKVKSNLLPFMYRRWYCILKKGVPIKAARLAREHGHDVSEGAQAGDQHDTGYSIAYWCGLARPGAACRRASRLSSRRVLTSPRSLAPRPRVTGGPGWPATAWCSTRGSSTCCARARTRRRSRASAASRSTCAAARTTCAPAPTRDRTGPSPRRTSAGTTSRRACG